MKKDMDLFHIVQTTDQNRTICGKSIHAGIPFQFDPQYMKMQSKSKTYFYNEQIIS